MLYDIYSESRISIPPGQSRNVSRRDREAGRETARDRQRTAGFQRGVKLNPVTNCGLVQMGMASGWIDMMRCEMT